MINFFRKHDKIKISSFIVLIILIFLRLYNKSFYDDEIGSIQIIDKFTNIIDLYFYVNNWDVSPPLSYILFYLGKLLFSYKYAPLILLPIQVVCINIFLKYSIMEKYIFDTFILGKEINLVSLSEETVMNTNWCNWYNDE